MRRAFALLDAGVFLGCEGFEKDKAGRCHVD
jgi:hypothetical protein